MTPRTFTRGQLARLAGVHAETIRFYERKGLLPAPPRTPNGYRQFPPAALQQLLFIKRSRRLGFSLAEIRPMLLPASGPAHVAALEDRIRELQAIRIALLSQ